MRAPNGMWMITTGTLTGPWHVASSFFLLWKRTKSSTQGTVLWSIVNMLTGKSKKIGRVQGRGVNFCDRAREIARERNKDFLAKHMADKSLPQFLGINPEFDKTIAQCLQGDKA